MMVSSAPPTSRLVRVSLSLSLFLSILFSVSDGNPSEEWTGGSLGLHDPSDSALWPLLKGQTVWGNVSELCIEQLTYLVQSSSNKTFAKQMLSTMDALPPVSYGQQVLYLGDYDICLRAASDKLKGNLSFPAKYCYAAKDIVDLRGIHFYIQQRRAVYGMCLPGGCSSDDVIGLIQSAPNPFTDLMNVDLPSLKTYTQGVCQEPVLWDVASIVCLIILCLPIAICLFSTILELVLKYLDTIRTQSLTESNEPGSLVTTSDCEATPLIKEPAQTSRQSRPSRTEMIFHCFSIPRNWSKILDTSQSSKPLSFMFGLRVVSMIWVIAGHTSMGISTFERDKILASSADDLVYVPLLVMTPVSVDIFFAMSAFLLIYLLLEKNPAKFGIKEWALAYLHRYLRLTPPYLLTFAFWLLILRHTGSGPMWIANGEPTTCANWWTNALYINNFFDKDCFAAWTWYLACDMQYFMCAIPLIALIMRRRKTGLIILAAMILGSTVYRMAVTGVYNLPVQNTKAEFSRLLHVNTFGRFQPYGVGLLAGCLLHFLKGELRMNRVVNNLVWAGCCLLIFLPLLGGAQLAMEKVAYDRPTALAYAGLYRLAIAIGFAGIMILCATGNAAFTKRVLSAKVSLPLGRLVYCAYLTNVQVETWFFAQVREPVTFTQPYMFVTLSGITAINFGIAALVSVVWEAPFMQLNKLILG